MTAEPYLNSYIYTSLVKSNDTSPVSVCGGGGGDGLYLVFPIYYVPLRVVIQAIFVIFMLMGYFFMFP